MSKKHFLIAIIILSVFGVKVSWAVNIAAFGDSITRGYPYYTNDANGLANNGGYIPSLQSQLRANAWGSGSTETVYNWGYPGERVIGDGEYRFPSVLSQGQPDYVLILEGTNDLSAGWGPGSVADTLNQLVLKTINDGRVPIIGTILPRTDHKVSRYDIIDVNTYIRSDAGNSGTEVADLYYASSNWDAYMPDGLHPEGTGFTIMANEWFATLVRYKEKKAAEEARRIAGAISGANFLLLLSD